MRASWQTLTSLAWRESRTARRRLLLYMSSISLGVAALVAIDSFASNVTHSVREQSRSLLGGDLAFYSRQKWGPQQDTMFTELEARGLSFARQVQFTSMAIVVNRPGTRLAQVRAITPGFPVYGKITTAPAEAWAHFHDGRNALVDESLLATLSAQVGDTLSLGLGKFVISGTLKDVPGNPGIAAAIGPRVFIPQQYVPETQLVVFGSRADYEVLARVPGNTTPELIVARYKTRLTEAKVRTRTVTQNETQLTNAIVQLGDFLGIVGLVALLLGGVGVASGVHAFVMRKIDTVAVLRCIGATSGQVLAIYVMQALAMGILGAAMGVALGVAIQFSLPSVMKDFLPVNVTIALEPKAILIGLAIGTWVALLFALRPLLALRTVSPLQALRRDADPEVLRLKWRDWPRLSVNIVMVASVVALAIERAGELKRGAWLAGGIGAVLLLLWLSATMLSAIAKRGLRRGWPYVVRQGVANLYRPANQTKAVVLALGFGAFLISTLYLVQANLLRRFDVARQSSRANLVLYDVQGDQGAGVDSIVRSMGEQTLETTPIVTMRISMINKWTMAQMVDSTNPDSVLRATWALRREYRSTYRADTLPASEKLIAGKWFGRTPLKPGEPDAEVSLEKDVARELAAQLGDVITWDVQGVKVRTRLTSLREVNFARFEPNFFAVFSPGSVDKAPKTFVVLANVRDPKTMVRIQRAVVERFPNVSSLDLSLIQKTVTDIVEKVSLAVRFLALFSLAIGIPVLFSAVAATGRARVREGVLLKVLGATQRQIRKIMLAEYALLGVLGSLTGMVLSFGGAWAVMKFVFKTEFAPATGASLAIAGAMLVVTLVIGLLGGRDVFKETPMAALREA